MDERKFNSANNPSGSSVNLNSSKLQSANYSNLNSNSNLNLNSNSASSVVLAKPQYNLSGIKMKKFIRHLCRISKHYHDRDNARKELQEHFSKVKQEGTNVAEEIVALNKKINFLLEKETKIASIGKNKNIPHNVIRKINAMELQLKGLQKERDKLLSENGELRDALDSIDTLREDIQLVRVKKENTEKRVENVAKIVDHKVKQYMIEELEHKINALEEGYKKISRDKTIDPARLFNIEQKIKEYKKELRKAKGLKEK